jgi:hypothetical protein
MTAGAIPITTPTGKETVIVDNGGAVLTTMTTQQIGTLGLTLNSGFVLNSVGSITPAGSNLATAALIATETVVLGNAASTTGVALPASAGVLGTNILILNQGTAAVHIYGQGGDTIDNTAGTTGVSLTNAHRCFFTAIASGAYVSGPEGGVTS